MRRLDIRRLIAGIEPCRTDSGCQVYPCEATLIDRSTVSRLLLVDVTTYRQIGVEPWPPRTLELQALASLSESSLRLPTPFAQAIYDGGETNMGGYSIKLLFENLEPLHYVAGDIIDFPDLPPSHSLDKLRGVRPWPGGRSRAVVSPAAFDVAHFW